MASDQSRALRTPKLSSLRGGGEGLALLKFEPHPVTLLTGDKVFTNVCFAVRWFFFVETPDSENLRVRLGSWSRKNYMNEGELEAMHAGV